MISTGTDRRLKPAPPSRSPPPHGKKHLNLRAALDREVGDDLAGFACCINGTRGGCGKDEPDRIVELRADIDSPSQSKGRGVPDAAAAAVFAASRNRPSSKDADRPSSTARATCSVSAARPWTLGAVASAAPGHQLFDVGADFSTPSS